MTFAVFLDTWRGLHLQNRILFGCVACLSVATLVLAWRTFSIETAVILVPEGLNRETRIMKDEADGKFREAWALFYAQLIGNVTPNTADFVEKTLAPSLSSSIYATVMKIVVAQVEDIKRDRVSLIFTPHEVTSEPASGKIFVTGDSVAEGPSGNAEKSTRTYEFKVDIQQYRPILAWVTSYKGAPRTLEELDREDAERKARAKADSDEAAEAASHR